MHYRAESTGYTTFKSEGVSATDVDVFELLSAFTRKDGKCFTYLPYGDKAYFMQVTEQPNVFCHGMVDNISCLKESSAAGYINMFNEKAPSNLSSGDKLPEGRLPRSYEFDFKHIGELKPIFADVINALVYTDKQVIIVGKGQDALVNYVKATLAMLPRQFANRIGFSVAPVNPASLLKDSGLRLVATEQMMESSELRYVVSTEDAPKNEDLGLYARVIKSILDSRQPQRFVGFVRDASSAFLDDGTIDEGKLKSSVTLYRFRNERGLSTAAELLDAFLSPEHDPITERDAASAIRELLHSDKLAEGVIRSIAEARRIPSINSEVASECGEYAYTSFISGERLDDAQIDDVVIFIGRLHDDDLNENNNNFKPLFAKPCNIEAVKVLSKVYAETKRHAVLKLIARYLDISKTFNIGKEFDPELFNIAKSHPECEADLVGAIMVSCYERKPNLEAKTKRRKAALYEYIKNHGDGGIDAIRACISAKMRVEQLAPVIGIEVRGAEDFAFLNNEDVRRLVFGLNFLETLSASLDRQINISSYAAISFAVIEKLADVESVKKNINLEQGLTEYTEFVSLYEGELTNYHITEIKEYLDELTSSMDMRHSIADYRCVFVGKSFENLRKSDRRQIREKFERYNAERKRDGEEPFVDEKTGKVTRETIKSFLTKNSKNDTAGEFKFKTELAEDISRSARSAGVHGSGGGSGVVGSTFLWTYIIAIGYMLLTTATILAVPIVIASLLGVDHMTRVAAFFELYHLGAILYVGILNMVTCLLSIRRARSHEALVRANTVTLLYGYLPILLYAAAYLITYILL